MLIHNADITGSLLVNGTRFNTGSFSGSFTGIVAGTTATASYVEYNSVANKPALVSGSSQITYSGLTGIPSGIVSGSSQVEYSGLTGIPSGIVSGSSQVTYSGLSGIPSGIVSGSAQVAALGFATTGSNTFQASQTITGSLFITQNLIVAGSSSIQYISSSVLDIADNIITVNAFNPGVRFGGLAVIDSGSSPQVSGSLLFDSIKDQWIFVHQNQSVVTSSVLLMGPETYNDLGNETYLGANRLPKGSGVEHLRDSNITDTGTVVSINSNTQVTGSLRVTGSLAVVGASTFSSTGTFSGIVGVNGSTEEGWALKSNGNLKIENNTGTTVLQVNDTATGGKTWSLISSGNGNVHSIPAGTFYLRNSSDSLTALSVTSTGNLGLGVTPSAWNAGGKAIEIGMIGSAHWGLDQTSTYRLTNAYWNSGWKYGGTGQAANYAQEAGAHYWSTAPSGTAGNAISFTQAMTLNASGNLSIGNTNDTYKLEVHGEARFYQPATSTTAYLRVENNRSRNAALNLKTTIGDFLLGVGVGTDTNQFQIYDNTAGANRLVISSTGAATFSSSVTATAGTFNLNTTNGGFKIVGVDATPTNLAYLANNYFSKFYTRNHNFGITFFDQSEATAIQSADLVNGNNARALILNPYGGNVGIGTSSPSNILEAAKASANNQIILTESSDSGDDTALFYARRSRGTSLSSPTATQALNNMGGLAMGGFNGTSYAIGAKVKAITNQNWTTSAQGSNLIFETTSDNSTTLTERMRITSNGLTFNGDTAAANALDDYEEGTWTPTIRGSGTAGTYEIAVNISSYTKIGRQVTANAFIILASSVTGGGSGYAQIHGLPFSKASNNYCNGTIAVTGIDYTGTYLVCEFISVSATNVLYISDIVDGGSPIDLSVSTIGANDSIKLTITYFV